MELFLPEQIVLDCVSNAILADVEETARRVNEYRPLPKDVVKRIEDGLVGERVYASNAIEGNALDLRETISVLTTGRLIENRKREAIEARNLGEAVDRISQIREEGAKAHSIDRLLEVHKLILRETPDEYWGGRFREQGVTITGAKFQPPDHSVVPGLVERVMKRLSRTDNEIPGLVRACRAHWALARIHPFKDGNGRIARLWQDLLLFQENFTCAIVRPEHRREYLSALTKADDGDFNALTQFAAQQVLRTFDRYLAEIAQGKEFDSFVEEIVGKTSRNEDKRELEYSRWARRMEQLRWEFEICASKITDAGGPIRIHLNKHEIINRSQWDTIRSIGAFLPETPFFRIQIERGTLSLQYTFYFDKHTVTEDDNETERSDNRIEL